MKFLLNRCEEREREREGGREREREGGKSQVCVPFRMTFCGCARRNCGVTSCGTRGTARRGGAS